MSFIVEQRIKGRIYLYQVESYWDNLLKDLQAYHLKDVLMVSASSKNLTVSLPVHIQRLPSMRRFLLSSILKKDDKHQKF